MHRVLPVPDGLPRHPRPPDNKAAFAGPRLFVRYAALEMHPLDTNDRRELLQDRMGLGMCNITKCCTEVCPEDIHITDNAIIPLKERVVDLRYDPIWRAFRRVFGRKSLELVERDRAEAKPTVRRVQVGADRRMAEVRASPSGRRRSSGPCCPGRS